MSTQLLNEVRTLEPFTARTAPARAGAARRPARSATPRVRDAALLKALDMTPGAVYFLGMDLEIVDANAAAARRSGYRRGELRGMRLEQVLSDDSGGGLSAGLARLVRGEAVAHRLPARQRSKDGCSLGVQLQVHVVEDEGTSLLVAVVHGADDGLAELERRESCDYLTALPVRAALEARMRRVERRAKRQGSHFAVLFIDVDRFKLVNDTHGHQIGDLVLQACGRRLLAGVRPGDFVARYGGDEFVAVLENVRSDAEAKRIAKRIREKLQEPIDLGGRKLRVSASVGLAIGDAQSSARKILNEADQAMYRVKRALRGAGSSG